MSLSYCVAQERRNLKKIFFFFFSKDETNAESAAFSSSNQSSVINAGLNWCLCFKISPNFCHSWKLFLFFLVLFYFTFFLSTTNENEKLQWLRIVKRGRSLRLAISSLCHHKWLSCCLGIFFLSTLLFSVHFSVFITFTSCAPSCEPIAFSSQMSYRLTNEISEFFFSCLEVNTSVTLHCLNFLFFLFFSLFFSF